MTLKEKVLSSKLSGMTLNQIFNKYPKHKQSTIKYYYYNAKPKARILADIDFPKFDLDKLSVETEDKNTAKIFDKNQPSDLIKNIWNSSLEETQKEQLVIQISKWM